MDTGPMVALFNKSDAYHAKSLKFIKSFKGKFVTSIASITEAIYLLDFDENAQFAFLNWIHAGAVEIGHVDNSQIERVVTLFKKHSDLPMDFADGCLVAIAEKLNVNEVATIDSDFEVYRIQRRKKFKIRIGR
jgi:hypothetical protein